ncbi:MAG: hypothetical protein WCF84_07380 [Anaerolineae bacterium]
MQIEPSGPVETQTNPNRRYIVYAGIGVLALLLVILLVFLFMTLTAKKPTTPQTAAAAATAQSTPGSAQATPQATSQATSSTGTNAGANAATPTLVLDTPTLAPTTGANAPVPTATQSSASGSAPVPVSQPARPGIYVSRITMDPIPLPNGEPPNFNVTFVNTTGAPYPYKWFIQIYRGDTNKRFGDTKWRNMNIDPGTNTLAAVQGWSVKVRGGCEPYYAQAEYVADDGSRVAFPNLSGNIARVAFNVCK